MATFRCALMSLMCDASSARYYTQPTSSCLTMSSAIPGISTNLKTVATIYQGSWATVRPVVAIFLEPKES